jgi:hypothetical protein
MPNDNEGPATITPTHRGRKAKSASKSSSKRPPPAATTDAVVTNKNKKQKQFDNRLAPVRELIESQPPAIKSLLSDTAIGLLLATQKLSSKRAGILAQRMNEDSFPRSVNIKAKLEFPPVLKDNRKTIENLHQWNDYLDEVKKKLKVKVLAQSDRTCEFLHKERFGLFMEKIVAIAEGYVAYHRQLEGAEGAPISDQTYGAAGVYYYYSRLPAGHEVKQYLGEDKSTSLAEVKAKYLVTADGSSAFHASQLLALSNFPVTPGQVAATPQQLSPTVAVPMRPPGDSPMANAQSQNVFWACPNKDCASSASILAPTCQIEASGKFRRNTPRLPLLSVITPLIGKYYLPVNSLEAAQEWRLPLADCCLYQSDRYGWCALRL